MVFGIDCFGDFVYDIIYEESRMYGSVCYFVQAQNRYRRSFVSLISETYILRE